MKKLFLAIVLGAVVFSFIGCERNDYQHPMHRSTK